MSPNNPVTASPAKTFHKKLTIDVSASSTPPSETELASRQSVAQCARGHT